MAHTPNQHNQWRKAVMARDMNKCVLCGAVDDLQVDHIKERRNFPELAYEVSNGRVLCKPCHKATPNYGGKLLRGTRLNRNPYGSL